MALLRNGGVRGHTCIDGLLSRRLNPHRDFHSLPYGEGIYKPDKIEDFMIETAILLVCLALSRKAYPTFVKHFGEMK
jgi:hypothetical protein